MATTLLSYRPFAVMATASSTERKAGPAGQRSPPSSSSSSSNSKWWSPIFGFSSEPAYIEPVDNKVACPRRANSGGSSQSAADACRKPARCRTDPIRFTEEKARLLRLMTSDAASHHDAMYHSAIASRLASDFGNRTEL